MANNNGDANTAVPRDLQQWFPLTAANPSNSSWDIAGSPWNTNAFFDVSSASAPFVADEPSFDGAAAPAYKSFMLNCGASERATTEQEKELMEVEARRRHGFMPAISEGSGEDDERPGGGGNKRHHSKNLEAERRRREKIRSRLHALRAIVPKITKMDKASILGDAIEYVKELQQQVKDLQDELEENDNNDREGKYKSQLDQLPLPNNDLMKQRVKSSGPSSDDDEEEKQQMEPQVEVKQLVANELLLMVLCEHKQGGFARLMEAMNALGLEVTNANVTTFRSLVLNVFRAEGRENIMVQAEAVRSSLLQMSRGGNEEIRLQTATQEMEEDGGEFHHRHRHHHSSNSRRCRRPPPPSWPACANDDD
ncbi:transcription factor ABORTED MICROSPORES-like [Canna indica]|uniref:Transcription factor ABORTED MICROSPORES-like n=1 Tax=Canna indica TaxID=4628 RepID=A0AAQ3L1P9_9LILI|nr:transcription factor ABORTED MICROSPORES-like [Canna indica]